MTNEIIIQTRNKKIPLKSEGRFAQIVYVQLLLNGVILYETNSDYYNLSKQALIELMLEKSSLLVQALEVTGNKVNIRHGSY